MSLNVTSNIGVINYRSDNSIYVAVGHNFNAFAYSTDGINWTESTISSTNRWWTSVCYGNNKFVAVSGGNGSTSNIFAYSTDGMNWTEGTISDTSRDWESVCYGNDKFVAVSGGFSSTSNIFAYSTDGIHWTEGTISDTSRYWTSVCYGNRKFVAVAVSDGLSSTSNIFAYSTDGIHWTESTMPISIDLMSVCYGNDKFVAVGGHIFVYSTDGINWEESRLPYVNNWGDVCYGNDKFVVIARESINFAYSTDGINWTDGIISDTAYNWESVCYGNGKFVAVADNSNTFVYSTDGINWTEGMISDTEYYWESVCYGIYITPEKAFNLSQPEKASTDEFTDKVILDSIVHHDSPMYLLINQKATDNNFYIHSPALGDITLTSFDRLIYPVNSNMNRNCIGGKLHPLGNGYVAYSVYSNNMDATSKFSDSDTGSLELITGVIKANPYLGYYKSVNGQGFYGAENDEDGFMEPYKEMNGKFIAVGYNSKYFAYSTDGITWTESTISSTSRDWYSVCYGNGKFVVVVYNSNYFAYSTDGINWTESTISSTSRKWRSACYGNGKFVTVANNSKYFAYSTDGITWTEGTISSTSRNWQSVCYGNGKFVAITYNSNYFAYSTDGINWTEGTISDTSRYWRSVCYGNGKFVTVSYDGYFSYSTDGITWASGTISNTSRKWRSVCYGNGKFVTVSYDGYFAYSTDGITWASGTISNTSRDWESVCYGTFCNIEFSNNHTGISSDVTDVNGISSMTTYTEQYTEDVYYIHYAWVDRTSSSLIRYNILTRKIDTSSGIPVISNLASYTTTFSIGTIAHPSFHKDKNGIHCAFYHGNTTYTKYYKLTRSGTDDSTWSWEDDSNTYITNENISLMVNKNENNLQSSLAQSARRMYMVNSNDKLVEFKKSQIF